MTCRLLPMVAPRENGHMTHRGERASSCVGQSLVALTVVLGASCFGDAPPPAPDVGEVRAPVWTSVGDVQTDAWFGFAVSGGDVNGDGFSDVIVAAPAFDTANPSAGKVYVFYGSATGPSALPDWTSVGDDAADTWFGNDVSAGDVNGDGIDDVVVAGPLFDTAAGSNVGKVWVYHGSTSGPGATPDWTGVGDDQPVANFGSAVSAEGDVDGDGFDDLVVGAAVFDSGASMSAGKAYLYLGSAGGLAAVPAWTAIGDDDPGAQFGYAVDIVGDVDGDLREEILVGGRLADDVTPLTGKAFLYRGAAGGAEATPAWTSVGDGMNVAEFGSELAGAGDVNGDGLQDFLVAAPSQDGVSADEGKVWLFGGAAPASSISELWSMSGTTAELLGTAVGGAGDVNGDGFSDFVLVDPNNPSMTIPGSGHARLFLGTAGALPATPAWESFGDGLVNGAFGLSVDSAGDVNGDGFDDLVVGAPFHPGDGSSQGKVHVFFGADAPPGLCDPPGVACDDGDPCTSGDVCDPAGFCAGTPNGTCSSDGGMDAGSDSGTDSGTDAGTDAGTDSGTDSSTDAGTDAGADSGTDAGADSGTDSGPMSVSDASSDSDLSGADATDPMVRGGGCNCRVGAVRRSPAPEALLLGGMILGLILGRRPRRPGVSRRERLRSPGRARPGR